MVEHGSGPPAGMAGERTLGALLFSGDKKFLPRTAYHFMKGAALFFVDY
jgi:hypothetical protein